MQTATPFGIKRTTPHDALKDVNNRNLDLQGRAAICRSACPKLQIDRFLTGIRGRNYKVVRGFQNSVSALLLGVAHSSKSQSKS